jgi:TPR repeat protein
MLMGIPFGKSELQSKEDQKIKIDLVEGAPEEEASLPAAFSPTSSKPSPPKSLFQRALDRLRMMQINQMGVISICAIFGFLATAYVLPSFDEARIPANFEATIHANDLHLLAVTNKIPITDGKAWFDAGMKFLLADGVHYDRDQALRCFNQAAAAGYVNAARYQSALTHSHHSQKEWLASAILSRNAPVSTQLNEIDDMWLRLDIENPDEKADYARLLKLADGGNSFAQWLIGYRLTQTCWPPHPTNLTAISRSSGLGVVGKDDFSEGMDYLSRSAENGFAPAEKSLAESFQDYTGPRTNNFFDSYTWHMQGETHTSLAHMWNKRAALQDLPSAEITLLNELNDEKTDKQVLRNVAAKAAQSHKAWFGREAAEKLSSAGDHEGALRMLCSTLGTTPETLAKDLDDIVLDETCDNEATLNDISRELMTFPKNYEELSNRVMVKRAERIAQPNGNEAADWLTLHGGDPKQISKLKSRK